MNNRLFQWDQGQNLAIVGGEAKYIDFSAPEEPSGIIRTEGNNGIFEIPDSWLQTSGNKTIWVCLADDTQVAVTLRVQGRPKPPTYVETPAHKITIDLLLERANQAVEEAESSANAAELAAQRAEANLKEKGWVVPELRQDGHLYLITENMDSLNLKLQKGRLIAVYE